jgi:hypothetical protein
MNTPRSLLKSSHAYQKNPAQEQKELDLSHECNNQSKQTQEVTNANQ